MSSTATRSDLYYLEDADGVFWVGVTTNAKQRRYSHRRKVSPTYPRSLDCTMTIVESFDSKADAMAQETVLIAALRDRGEELLNQVDTQAHNWRCHPDFRERLSESAKRRWARPEERKAQSDRVKAHYQKDKK